VLVVKICYVLFEQLNKLK